MKALLILNAGARKSRKEAIHRAVGQHLHAAGIESELHETRTGEHPGDVVRERLVDGVDLVLAAGGDGTVAAVLDGLAGTEIPLGIIPAGTANFVARELGIPQSIDAAVALIAANPHPVKIDAMRIRGRLYVLNVGVGLSAAVIGNMTPTSKRRFGFVAYVGSTIAKMLTQRPRRLTVEVDGQTHTYCAVEVLVSNCGLLTKRLYPGTPDIRVDDGHLDVWVLSTQALLDYPRYLLSTVLGRRSKLEAEFLRAERMITIHSPVPLSVQADGDLIGTTPVRIEVLPKALTVLAPANATRGSHEQPSR
ncbi:MAG: diacylglycerol kinase family lipid kinase [Candidatus Bipolaricaulota bacterium]